ncbi:hypothetical protein JL722_11467 [Aureococcus anophagefferens]|nr:hypothetical protein JL722_11467 [Aureococcus anophagefferens]
MDPTCVYDHTPDLVKRSRLLRALLAYDEPLTIIVAGDVACRLKLPATHHAYVLSGDAGAASCAANGAACVNPRKPSREKLVKALRGGQGAALEALARGRPGLRLETSLADGGDVVYGDLGEPGDHDGAIARSRPSPTTRDWYGDHADSPAVPGATCGTTLPTEMEGVDLGMLCFDAACAPPSVAAFECRNA